MAASKQNVNYDLKEVARTTESLNKSVVNVTEIIETISNLETTSNPIVFDLGTMFLPETTTDLSNFGLSFGLESGFFDLATEILEISFDSAINWSGMSVALVKMNKKIDNLQSSGGSGSEFIGFGLNFEPLFRVRVHRVHNLKQVSGSGLNTSGSRVYRV